jgi:CheY-like chemotaxis protein
LNQVVVESFDVPYNLIVKRALPTRPLSEPHDDEATHDLSTGQHSESVAADTNDLSQKDFLVLIVDDVVDNIVIVSLDLQQQGYRVVTASNGEEAVKVASLTYPDIILMDIGMPQLDGLGATRKIRENEALRNVPIIAITAFNTDGFRRAAHDAGFDGYLVKPFDFDRLHALIRGLLPVK